MEQHPTLFILFSSGRPNPDTGLEKRILDAVAHERRRAFVLRRNLYVGVAVLSVAGMVPAVIALGTQASQSGFLQYLSLTFSDGGTLWTMGKDFGLILAESLPVMNLILVTGILAVLCWSIRKTFKPHPYAKLLSNNQGIA